MSPPARSASPGTASIRKDLCGASRRETVATRGIAATPRRAPALARRAPPAMSARPARTAPRARRASCTSGKDPILGCVEKNADCGVNGVCRDPNGKNSCTIWKKCAVQNCLPDDCGPKGLTCTQCKNQYCLVGGECIQEGLSCGVDSGKFCTRVHGTRNESVCRPCPTQPSTTPGTCKKCSGTVADPKCEKCIGQYCADPNASAYDNGGCVAVGERCKDGTMCAGGPKLFVCGGPTPAPPPAPTPPPTPKPVGHWAAITQPGQPPSNFPQFKKVPGSIYNSSMLSISSIPQTVFFIGGTTMAFDPGINGGKDKEVCEKFFGMMAGPTHSRDFPLITGEIPTLSLQEGGVDKWHWMPVVTAPSGTSARIRKYFPRFPPPVLRSYHATRPATAPRTYLTSTASIGGCCSTTHPSSPSYGKVCDTNCKDRRVCNDACTGRRPCYGEPGMETAASLANSKEWRTVAT